MVAQRETGAVPRGHSESLLPKMQSFGRGIPQLDRPEIVKIRKRVCRRFWRPCQGRSQSILRVTLELLRTININCRPACDSPLEVLIMS